MSLVHTHLMQQVQWLMSPPDALAKLLPEERSFNVTGSLTHRFARLGRARESTPATGFAILMVNGGTRLQQ